MLTRILHNSQELCTFVDRLGLALSVPQRRHVVNVVDGLLVTDAPKTVAEIQRQFVDGVDPSNMADTFRIAPWTAQDIRQPLGAFLMQTALERLERTGQPRRLLINLDDSLAIKDARTHCLQGVDWHYYHVHKRKKRTRLQNGWAYLACNVIAGDWTCTCPTCAKRQCGASTAPGRPDSASTSSASIAWHGRSWRPVDRWSPAMSRSM